MPPDGSAETSADPVLPPSHRVDARLTTGVTFLPRDRIGLRIARISESDIFLGSDEKPIVWIGASLDDLRDFPEAARVRAGHELHRVQLGLAPTDWRPIATVGVGVSEIRITTATAGGRVTHRVFYVARFEEAVYVLHAFQKTTRATARRHIRIARGRYRIMSRVRDDR